jgi:hypothetical protein
MTSKTAIGSFFRRLPKKEKKSARSGDQVKNAEAQARLVFRERGALLQSPAHLIAAFVISAVPLPSCHP